MLPLTAVGKKPTHKMLEYDNILRFKKQALFPSFLKIQRNVHIILQICI